MKSSLAILSVVLVAAIGLSAYTLAVYLPSTGSRSNVGLGSPGTLNVYLTDKAPSNVTIKYVLVNVSDVDLKYEGNVSSSPPENQFVFNVSSKVGTNVNLTSLQGNSILLGATKIPAGNVTGIVLDITGATATYTDGTSNTLKVVADGKLMIPVSFMVGGNSTTNLTLDITPNMIHTSQGTATVLTPVIHATAVNENMTTTETNTVETTENTTETVTSASGSGT